MAGLLELERVFTREVVLEAEGVDRVDPQVGLGAEAWKPGLEGWGRSLDCWDQEEAGHGKTGQRTEEMDNMATEPLPCRFERDLGASSTSNRLEEDWFYFTFSIMSFALDKFGESEDKGIHCIVWKEKQSMGCAFFLTGSEETLRTGAEVPYVTLQWREG